MADEDDLYWEAEKPAPDPASPKRKRVQEVEEESLDDTVSMIKSGLSTKKTRQTTSKTSGTSSEKQEKKTQKDSPTIALQATLISQLTEQVNEIKQTNKTFIVRFDQLAKQRAALLAATQQQQEPHALPEAKPTDPHEANA